MEKAILKSDKGYTRMRGRGVRRALTALAVALTALLALALLGLGYVYREMCHEGLTYSQWYEGSIYGFYNGLLAVIACAGLCAGVWALALRRGKPAGAGNDRRRMALAGAAALLADLFVWLSLRDYGAIRAARAAGAECLAPYIRAYGIHRVCGLAAVEAMIAGIVRMTRGGRRDEDRQAVS